MQYAAKELFNVELSAEELAMGSKRLHLIDGKNQDFQDMILYSDSNQVLLKFAKAYGFRNIQNLVRKLKLEEKSKTKTGYHFVEVMACPSGCINGGGQLKPTDSKWSSLETSSNSVTRQFVASSEEKYRNIENQGPFDNGAVMKLYAYVN